VSLHAADSTFDQVLNFHYSLSILHAEDEAAGKGIAIAAPAMPDRVSGHGDLPIACANLRDGADRDVVLYCS
jgi:hypothetical protein